MAAKKKAARAGAGGDKFNKSQFIRDNPGLSAAEVVQRALSEHGEKISMPMVYVVRNKAKKKGAKNGALPIARKTAARAAAPKFAGGRSLAEMLADPNQVAAAKAAIEAEIKELEATIASRKTTLKILNAAG